MAAPDPAAAAGTLDDLAGLGVVVDVDVDVDDVWIREGATLALPDVLAVLRLCAGGRLRCSEKTKRPAATAVGLVSEVLRGGDFYDGDPIAAYAWPLLLQAGGLAEVAGSRLQLTAKGRAASTAPPERTIRTLWTRWISHAVIDEMSRVEEIKGQRSARALTAAGPRRRAVGQALAACPPGRWLRLDDLFAVMYRSKPGFSVARDPWKLYLVDAEYASLGYAGFGEWPIIEGRYTLAVLFEYAGTLGLFDLAYGDAEGARDDFRDNWGADDIDALSRYDGLVAIRLNRLGTYVFGLEPAYTPEVLDGDLDDANSGTGGSPGAQNGHRSDGGGAGGPGRGAGPPHRLRGRRDRDADRP